MTLSNPETLLRGSGVKRFLCATMMALGLAGCVAAPAANVTRNVAPVAELLASNEVIALVPTRAAANRVRNGAAELGFVLIEDVALEALGLWMIRFTFPETYDGPSAIAALEALDPTTTAGVNHAYRPAAVNVDVARFDYATPMLAWPEGGCRAQGPIGMLDTGVDRAAVEALGATLVSESFARGGPTATRHGTDVASVLMDPRRMSGVRLYSAAVVGRTSRGTDLAGVDSIMKALDWLAAEGVTLVNVSLAGPYNKLLDLSVGEAIKDGMTIVAAVGNDGANGAPRYPAALDNVIAVTAVDEDRNIYRNAIRGQHVDIAAPGVDIPVPTSGQVRFVTGTSMAVPFVTARIATDPRLFGRPASRIRSGLSNSTADLGAPGSDSVFGAGLLQANSGCAR